MADITAKMVAELREITGLGMMECKKALVEAAGDIKKAVEVLRVKSGIKAGKAANRTAADGVVVAFVSDDGKQGALVEVNSETDFVAKDENFVNFANAIAEAIVREQINSLEQLNNTTLTNGKTVEENRQELIAKFGENITVRRFEAFKTTGHVATYLHGKKIGVAVDMIGGDMTLGKDIAMHIAATKPICVSKEHVPSDKLDAERSIYKQQAATSGKPADIIDKMVEGRINKFLAEVTLLGQQFVKNPDVSVAQLLANNKAQVNNFAIFVVGEGIDKPAVDFAQEVASMARK